MPISFWQKNHACVTKKAYYFVSKVCGNNDRLAGLSGELSMVNSYSLLTTVA